MRDYTIPIYLFTGLLESGKTSFIKKKMKDPHFNSGEKTMIIVCETGIEEFSSDDDSLRNSVVIYIDNEDYVSKEYFERLNDDSIERVLIEYNGLWQLEVLYNSLPNNWLIFQQLMFVDASTFNSYNKMFRNQIAKMLKDCEMCIFNRLNDEDEKEDLHKNARMFSLKSDIYYEYIDHKIEKDNKKVVLPFDLTSDIITIKLKDYAIWYLDITSDFDKYNGREIQIEGQIRIDVNTSSVIFGRKVMVCCEADIKFLGMKLIYETNISFEVNKWYKIKGKIEKNEGEIPIKLHVGKLEMIDKPNINEEVATF